MFCLRRMCFPTMIVCVGILFFYGTARSAEPIVDGKAILALSRGSNLCALTFDDGPSRHTARLLDILRDRGIRATFFVVGSQVRYHPQIVQRMRDEGHEIGNHTNTHVSLRHLSPEAQRAEISTVQTALARLGVTARFIRPPYGRYDANTLKIAGEQNMGLMLWSVDSMDWTKQVRIENMKMLFSGQKLRGVFLFHDTHAPTVDAMPDVLDRLIADGCQFVTVSEFADATREETNEPKTLLVEKQTETPETAISETTERANETKGLSVRQKETTGIPEVRDAVSPSVKPVLASPKKRTPLGVRPAIPASAAEEDLAQDRSVPARIWPESLDKTANVQPLSPQIGDVSVTGQEPKKEILSDAHKTSPVRLQRERPENALPDPA